MLNISSRLPWTANVFKYSTIQFTFLIDIEIEKPIYFVSIHSTILPKQMHIKR